MELSRAPIPSSEALEIDVEKLDAAVERAIRLGRPRGLRVLGYGELTLVIGWPTEDPLVAVKRLPPFRDANQFQRYAQVLGRYLEVLRERGVVVADTSVHGHEGPNRSVRGYLVQPFVPSERHLNVVLDTAEKGRAGELLANLVDLVHDVVDDEVGLDAQAANWWVEDGELAYFDVSTPILRDESAREQLDISLFLSIYPWAVRPVLAWIAPGVMAQYHDPRTVLLDVASNLHKEGLDHRIPALLETANRRLARPLQPIDVRRYFRQDKALWALMQRLRLVEQSWQRRVRRRPYPILLPPPYRYGPPASPKERPR